MEMMKSGQIFDYCLTLLVSWLRIRPCGELGEFEMILLSVHSCMIFISLPSIGRISRSWFARRCEKLIQIEWFEWFGLESAKKREKSR
jgi:hypothetical protein